MLGGVPILLIILLVAWHEAQGVLGDGTGFIGYGKTLYNPTCAFACRSVIKSCRLLCTPTGDDGVNHGTAHNPVSTPPGCFVSDDAFLRTMALCIDNYCALSDRPPLSLIEDYWASHLGTGTLGNYAYVPAKSYPDTLAAAREDERRATNISGGNHGHTVQPAGDPHANHKCQSAAEAGPNVASALPPIKPGQPLNRPSFVLPGDWQKQYNGLLDFEANETGHSTYSIVVMLVAMFLPVPLSLVRFIPGLAASRAWTSLQSGLIQPAAWGSRHREPVAGGGTMPTRSQALYILLISLLNVVFLLAPYTHRHPQGTFSSIAEQSLSVIGNRAGVMAMGNAAAMFLFAARNHAGALLRLTDWSYGTFLLLHRWLGYWTVLLAALHSVLLLRYYILYGDYAAELARAYWVWGIVATVAACAMVPTALPVVRRAWYEVFLASHVALALLFVIGYYYHIWFCYSYSWGYEIWAFLAAGIWAAERLARVLRMVWQGYRTAVVAVVPDTEGEYLTIDVGGRPLADGVAYLTFPTLGWRVWESHPFSVAFLRGSIIAADDDLLPQVRTIPASMDTTAKEAVVEATMASRLPTPQRCQHPTTAFAARVRTGVTRKLAQKAATAGGSLRLGVLVDGPYHHSGAVGAELSRCSSIVYVAGGVGITAVLPYLRQVSRPSRLFWSSRRAGLVSAMEPALEELPATVEVETSVGRRLDLDTIIRVALTAKPEDDTGLVGVVVSGPAGMADLVRHKVVQISRSASTSRPYVLVDEAFSW